MTEELNVKIHWHGAYSFDDEEQLKKRGNGIYLLTGKRAGRGYRDDIGIQYIGITELSFWDRFKDKNHKIHSIKELEIWCGEIQYPSTFTRQHLELSESLIVYYWQPNLNERKKVYPPSNTTVVSHWFKRDGEPRLRQHTVLKNLSDVISWDGIHWRVGNLNIYEE
jgi:hypothetical protein